MEPSRPILAERENQQSIAFTIGERSATLSMAPGTAGPNHFRLDISGDPLPAKATANVLLAPPVDMAGQKSVDLERTTGNTFEAHTAEMSVVGDWGMTLTVSQVGAFQWSPSSRTRPPSGSRARARSAFPTWTINGAGLIGFLAAMAGIIGLVIGWRADNRSTRREGYGLGSVAIAAGLLLLTQGRVGCRLGRHSAGHTESRPADGSGGRGRQECVPGELHRLSRRRRGRRWSGRAGHGSAAGEPARRPRALSCRRRVLQLDSQRQAGDGHAGILRRAHRRGDLEHNSLHPGAAAGARGIDQRDTAATPTEGATPIP